MAQPADSIHIHNAAERAAAHAGVVAAVFPSGMPTTIPASIAARGWGDDTVIVCQGHGPVNGVYSHEDYKTGLFCDELVAAGFTVIPVMMPGNGLTSNHNAGNIPLAEFIRPATEAANWASVNRGGKIYMVGLSGGAWTTILAQAIIEQIEIGIALAGWSPEYKWPTPTSGDWEQRLSSRMPPYSYLDLAILACSGNAPRRHLQILNEVDQCCFNRTWHNNGPAYVNEVNAVLSALGASGQLSQYWQQQYLHEWSVASRQDAIRFLRGIARPTRTIKDNDHVRTGTWTYWTTTSPQGYGGGCYTAANNSGGTCTWSHDCSGPVKIYATWVKHLNRGTTVPYRIRVDGGEPILLRINQELTPRPDFEASTGHADYLGIKGTYNFQLLAEVHATANVSIEVATDGAGEYVSADAVMFETE